MGKYFDINKIPLWEITITENMFDKDKEFFKQFNPRLRIVNNKWFYDFYCNTYDYYAIKQHIERMIENEKNN